MDRGTGTRIEPRVRQMIYDVIVVGSGPGGSSAASFLARQGISTLLLDKTPPPRDTVRTDGLMPQAVYWLDRLGCVDAVLAEAKGCIRACDLYVDGEHLLTGRFPDDALYPDFAVLIIRQRFDAIVVDNAVAHGACFIPKTLVRDIEYEPDCVRVIAETDHQPVEYRGRIVIGADGSSSAISRAIGNTLKNGVLGVSVRTTYQNVDCDSAQIRVYFNRDYFPGYGWLFVDDHRAACVGLGYAFDKNFPMMENFGAGLRKFIDTDLSGILGNATRCGPLSGAMSGYYRPKSIVADRVVLIGDAANQTDPLNRGGIHTAMESAYCAVEACRRALEVGDFSRQNSAALRGALERAVRAGLAGIGNLHVDHEEPQPQGLRPLRLEADRQANRCGPTIPRLCKRGVQRRDLAEHVAVAARPLRCPPQGSERMARVVAKR